MLETIKLCKTYKTKKGVEVAALRDVSIRFPEKGMVFLLGKSGSGKSTLLNLLGGLDQYDSGSIMLDGTSTTRFSQSDLDSYRNACLGFIFQEYNVLPEFTVGVNIALALELQGKKATSEEITRILEEVDLAGYASRRPNELSGGQLQRVAIARALVKNPKIILADEPTGALDSATGKQVFDTLKKLSQDKLVIIVSHDREYSERYADRIIELKDGRVISDVTKTLSDGEAQKRCVIENSICKVPVGYELTPQDRSQINAYIAEHPQEGIRIQLDENLSRGFSFEPTREPAEGAGDGLFRKIRSKLPMRRAFPIGVTALKSKKVKLVFKILLSVIGFTLLGLSVTLADYNYEKSVSKVFTEHNIRSVYVERQTEGHNQWSTAKTPATAEEVARVAAQPGVSINPIYRIGNLSVEYGDDESNNNVLNELMLGTMNRWLEIDEDLCREYNCKMLAGELPNGSKNEIVISKVAYDMIRNQAMLSGQRIPKLEDMVGWELKASDGTRLTVTGVIETGLNYVSYVSAMTELIGSGDEDGVRLDLSWNTIKAMFLALDFQYDLKSNLASCNLVGKGFIERQRDFGLLQFQSRDFEFLVGNGVYGRNILVGDLSMKDRYEVFEFNNETTAAAEETIDCYVSKNTVTELLRVLLNKNNRRYLGIEEEIAEAIAEYEEDLQELEEYYNEHEGEIYVDPEDGEPNGSEDEPVSEPKETDENFGTALLLTGSLSERELAENNIYIKQLNDEKLAALFARIAAETPIDTRYVTYDPNLGYEAKFKKMRFLGMLVSKTAVRDSEMRLLTDQSVIDTVFKLPKGIYSGAMVTLPEDREEMKQFIHYSVQGENGVRFQIQTKYNAQLDASKTVMEFIRKGLLYVGLFFAIFAALLLTSFIANSIAYKRREIGILRAIGSRGADVYRIFGSESATLAMISFVLATLLTCVLAGLANRFLLMSIHVSLMEVGIRQILFMAAVAFGTAAVASFIPVFILAHKRPIEVIRGK